MIDEEYYLFTWYTENGNSGSKKINCNNHNVDIMLDKLKSKYKNAGVSFNIDKVKTEIINIEEYKHKKKK